MALGYLVRHAQTDWNLQNRLQGHSDLPLNALGRSQAAGVAKYFSARPIGAVYTSHLARSRQTADAVAERAGCAAPTVEPALAEIHLGAWEGLTPQDINARFGGAYDVWKTAPSQVTIPEAEPLGTFRRRVLTAARRIFARHPSGDVVIVTHGGVISSLLAEWLGADYDRLLRRLSLDNGGVSALAYEPLTEPFDFAQGSALSAVERAEPAASLARECYQPKGWWPHILWINETTHLVNGNGQAA